MRKLLSFFVVLTSFFFFSCSSEEDIRSDGSLPFYLNVYIEDAEGNSYLNPEHERCINLDKSKVYSVLEDGSLKLHSDDDYQYNDYATDENGHCLETYYGYIEEIWELDYGPTFKIPLFRCKWVKLTGGGVVVDQKYGMTTVDLNNLAYMDEPFVLANDVAQVFYVKDMSTKTRKRNQQKKISSDEPKRHIVLSGKRNIVGVDDKTDMSEDYNKFHEIPPFKVKTDPSILLNDEDSPWLRPRRKQK